MHAHTYIYMLWNGSELCNHIVLPSLPYGISAVIRRAAIREANAPQNHGGPIMDPLQPLVHHGDRIPKAWRGSKSGSYYSARHKLSDGWCTETSVFYWISWIWTVITFFQLIWHHKKFRLVPNQSKKFDYNQNLV